MYIGVYTGAQMKALDGYTIEYCGTDGLCLMQNAAEGIVSAVQSHSALKEKTCVIVCGRGNNAGDGFAAAPLLSYVCAQVVLICLAAKETLSPDAAYYFERAKAQGIPCICDLPSALLAIKDADVVVDALYGFGFRGVLGGDDLALVREINTSSAYVVSADIPSGVSADGGVVEAEAVHADLTVTFTGYKLSAILFESCMYYGKIEVADIGISQEAKAKYPPLAEVILPETALSALGARRKNAHKGDLGKVFLLGGSRGMSGAVYLSAQAALRSGAGLVCAGVPESLMQIMEIKTTEAMSWSVRETDGGLSPDASAVEKANTYDALAFGMGAGRTAAVAQMLQLVLEQGIKPVVVDADGLYALATMPDVLDGIKRPVIITPHSGEMARLCGMNVAAVEADRIGCAKAFAIKHNVCVVLKGAHTVVAAPDGRVAVNCLAGNSGMATAGSGDVLSGICALMLTRTTDVFAAAQAAVYLHALAGDFAAKIVGEDGMLAGDIVEMLPRAICSLRELEKKGLV